MVFESVVVDVLNRFLGDYVVNVDSSQLSLGIWGGNERKTRLARPRLKVALACLNPSPISFAGWEGGEAGQGQGQARGGEGEED